MVVFSLVFANRTKLSSSFFFFLIIEFYFLVPVVNAETFNHSAELIMLTERTTNEAKIEIKAKLLSDEPLKKKKNALHNLKLNTLFYTLSSSSCYVLVFVIGNFLFHLFHFSLKPRLAFYFVLFVFKVLIVYLTILSVVIKRK